MYIIQNNPFPQNNITYYNLDSVLYNLFLHK